MNYEIKGGQFPVLIFNLDAGETIYSEVGGMSWMSEHMKMDTNTGGGLLKGLGRTFAGESLFLNYYTAVQSEQTIAFASGFPGKIMPVEFDGTNELIAQKRAFLCATPDVNLQVTFTKKFGAGLLGGEGFVLQKLSGRGTAFLEIDGDAIEYNLAPGQTMTIDQTHLAAMDSSVSFDIKTVKGMKNIVFGGEGLFVGTVTGPGRVWLQSMPFAKLMGSLMLNAGKK